MYINVNYKKKIFQKMDIYELYYAAMERKILEANKMGVTEPSTTTESSTTSTTEIMKDYDVELEDQLDDLIGHVPKNVVESEVSDVLDDESSWMKEKEELFEKIKVSLQNFTTDFQTEFRSTMDGFGYMRADNSTTENSTAKNSTAEWTGMIDNPEGFWLHLKMNIIIIFCVLVLMGLFVKGTVFILSRNRVIYNISKFQVCVCASGKSKEDVNTGIRRRQFIGMNYGEV